MKKHLNPDPRHPPIGTEPTYEDEQIPDGDPFIPTPPGDGDVIQLVILEDESPEPHPYPDPNGQDPDLVVTKLDPEDPNPPVYLPPDTPDDPNDDPKEIHVWVNEEPEDTPVYLHTYTYEVAEIPEIDDVKDLLAWIDDNPTAPYTVSCSKTDSIALNDTKYKIPNLDVVAATSVVPYQVITSTSEFPKLPYINYIGKYIYTSDNLKPKDYLDGQEIPVVDKLSEADRQATSVHLKNITFKVTEAKAITGTDRMIFLKSVKRPFPEHRFTNGFPNEKKPEIA